MRPSALLFLFVAACGAEPSSPPPSPGPTTPTGPLTLEHDFGVVPHGETRQHEFPLDLKQLPGDFLPLRVHLDCSCGHADVRWRAADGKDRFVDGAGTAASRGGPGETLVLRVVLDTSMKEAVDLPKTTSRGFVVLQEATDMTGQSRISWPMLLKFGIDAPVELRPFAALDFGRVPQSQTGRVLTTVRGDAAHPKVRFTAATSDHPDVTIAMEPAEDHCVLRATCRPHDLGNHRALVTVENDLPGYLLRLQVTWKVVPDLEATPLPKLIVQAPLATEQPMAKAVGQFVLVADHDLARPPEFAVHKVVGEGDRDLSAHFATWLEPVPEQPRQHRLFARYLGGLQRSERGTIVLTKNGAVGPFLPIELVVFDKK
jgi:hypothetical protein